MGFHIGSQKEIKRKENAGGFFQLPLDVKWELGLECARTLAVIALCQKPSDLLKTRPTGNKMANEYLHCFSHTAMRLNGVHNQKAEISLRVEFLIKSYKTEHESNIFETKLILIEWYISEWCFESGRINFPLDFLFKTKSNMITSF